MVRHCDGFGDDEDTSDRTVFDPVTSKTRLVNLFRSGEPVAVIIRRKKVVVDKSSLRQESQRKAAEKSAVMKKHCTSCGSQLVYIDQTLAEWGSVRRCPVCISKPSSKMTDRKGKFCMNCGNFFTIESLLAKGVSPKMGLSTWSSCGCI